MKGENQKAEIRRQKSVGSEKDREELTT